ncbi:hypothetical protein KBY55_19610 [Streptomyces sp. b94]|uniref:hypothetical protein n=1 Tax=Streptomyces sp. b94 TaxID=1827634 RepID=UPI001B38F00A|nr:hypothetical protein [Streptomyces sp. b94]MBQ1098234.1 hypothetical protein [Streptomyces sp. b94]
MDLGDPLGQLAIPHQTGAGLAAATGTEGGPGDLNQLTRPLDAVTCLLLRLDERVHRVLLREESCGPLEDADILAQPTVSRPQRGQLLPLASGQPVALTRVDLSLLHPVPHRGLGGPEALGNLPDRAVTPSAEPDDLSLELGVNERRGRRGLSFSILSMMDILSGLHPVISNVRQSGSSSYAGCLGVAAGFVRRDGREDSQIP